MTFIPPSGRRPHNHEAYKSQPHPCISSPRPRHREPSISHEQNQELDPIILEAFEAIQIGKELNQKLRESLRLPKKKKIKKIERKSISGPSTPRNFSTRMSIEPHQQTVEKRFRLALPEDTTLSTLPSTPRKKAMKNSSSPQLVSTPRPASTLPKSSSQTSIGSSPQPIEKKRVRFGLPEDIAQPTPSEATTPYIEGKPSNLRRYTQRTHNEYQKLVARCFPSIYHFQSSIHRLQGNEIGFVLGSTPNKINLIFASKFTSKMDLKIDANRHIPTHKLHYFPITISTYKYNESEERFVFEYPSPHTPEEVEQAFSQEDLFLRIEHIFRKRPLTYPMETMPPTTLKKS